MGNNIDWETYDITKNQFKTLKEAEKWLSNEYFYCKKIINSYVDDKNGNAKKSGKIYCFKSDPVSYDDCKHYEQHWVSIYQVNTKEIDF